MRLAFAGTKTLFAHFRLLFMAGQIEQWHSVHCVCKNEKCWGKIYNFNLQWPSRMQKCWLVSWKWLCFSGAQFSTLFIFFFRVSKIKIAENVFFENLLAHCASESSRTQTFLSSIGCSVHYRIFSGCRWHKSFHLADLPRAERLLIISAATTID